MMETLSTYFFVFQPNVVGGPRCTDCTLLLSCAMSPMIDVLIMAFAVTAVKKSGFFSIPDS